MFSTEKLSSKILSSTSYDITIDDISVVFLLTIKKMSNFSLFSCDCSVKKNEVYNWNLILSRWSM